MSYIYTINPHRFDRAKKESKNDKAIVGGVSRILLKTATKRNPVSAHFVLSQEPSKNKSVTKSLRLTHCPGKGSDGRRSEEKNRADVKHPKCQQLPEIQKCNAETQKVGTMQRCPGAEKLRPMRVNRNRVND